MGSKFSKEAQWVVVLFHEVVVVEIVFITVARNVLIFSISLCEWRVSEDYGYENTAQTEYIELLRVNFRIRMTNELWWCVNACASLIFGQLISFDSVREINETEKRIQIWRWKYIFSLFLQSIMILSTLRSL